MNKELVLHFNFVLIFVLVSGHFCNFLLVSNSGNSSLKSLGFIGERFIQSADSFSSFHLILINLHNNLLKLHFSLNSILLSFSLILRLFNYQIVLLFQGVFQILRFKLRWDQILLQSIQHMFILLLRQFFISVIGFQILVTLFGFRF